MANVCWRDNRYPQPLKKWDRPPEIGTVSNYAKGASANVLVRKAGVGYSAGESLSRLQCRGKNQSAILMTSALHDLVGQSQL